MAQALDEQISTIERALGECMIEHAMVIVRSWLTELGESNPYEEAYNDILTRYRAHFVKWLNLDDPQAQDNLSNLTGEAYQLVDAVYADIRLLRGISPDMHSFNADSPQSVMNYFANNIRLRQEDMDWLHEVIADEKRQSVALLAINALTRNLRQCFNMDAFLVLIDGMSSENELVADQCMANVFTMIIHYDVRIDYFPQLQDAFANAIADMGDGGDHAFEVLSAVVASSPVPESEAQAAAEEAWKQIPDLLRELFDKLGLKEEIPTMMAWVPKSEQEYMAGIIQILPHSWLYEVLVEGEPSREETLTRLFLRNGNRELMWMHRDYAENYFLELLRKGSTNPMDYINYGHCLLLRGDRMMAFENYKQARQLCGSVKSFYDIFRPDRRQLVDSGIPLDYIYIIEDQLLNP